MSAALTDPPRSSTYVPVVSPQAYAVELDGQAVVLDQTTNRLHLLNSAATLLWSCFDGESTLGEICTLIANEVEASYDIVLRDSIAAVDGLIVEGLLVRDPEAVPAPEPLPTVGVIPEPVNH